MTHDIGLLGRAILRREANRARQRAAKLRTLHNIGTILVSSADVDRVLTRVVEAAVFISNAEEGSLLLLDEGTDELYLRAQKGLGEKYANGYRLRVEDSIAGEVLQTGLSQRWVSKSDGLKVVTGYMVNSIVYVPVCGENGTIGVLSVDNQVAEAPFTDDDEEFLVILAGYAALALENARRIEELQRQSAEAAERHSRQLPVPVHDTDVDSTAVVVYRDHTRPLFQAPSSTHLLELLTPYLSAVADIQHCIDELEGRPHSKVRILATTHDSPAMATIEGAQQAAAIIGEVISPQRQQFDDLASHLLLAEKEAGAERARLELSQVRAHLTAHAGDNGASRPDFAEQVAQLHRLQDDCESFKQELQRNKIDLACDLMSWIAPPLSCVETIHYVIRLLPALDQVLSSPLCVSMTQKQEDVQPEQRA